LTVTEIATVTEILWPSARLNMEISSAFFADITDEKIFATSVMSTALGMTSLELKAVQNASNTGLVSELIVPTNES